MNFLLQRKPSDQHRTHGDLYILNVIDGAERRYWQNFTLEDPVRVDDPLTPENEGLKILGSTAIPAGRYRITLETSRRFGPKTITINNVPDFTDIRMHGGNTEADTRGCPLVGQERVPPDNPVMIRRCQFALDALKAKIGPVLETGEEIWIEIRNAA